MHQDIAPTGRVRLHICVHRSICAYTGKTLSIIVGWANMGPGGAQEGTLQCLQVVAGLPAVLVGSVGGAGSLQPQQQLPGWEAQSCQPRGIPMSQYPPIPMSLPFLQQPRDI